MFRGAAPFRHASVVPARGRWPRCRLRARRPAAARGVQFSMAHQGASSSSRATVRARHSTMSSSPAFQLPRSTAGSLQLQHAGVDEQAAVAVLGQAGQSIEAAHLHAGPLEGLQQRIGEPLRELVERHPAVGEAVAAHIGVAPAVAQRHAAQRVGRRPDAGQRHQQLRQDVVRRHVGRGRHIGPVRADEHVEQSAGPALGPKISGCAAMVSPSRRSSTTRPSRPTSGFFGPTWKAAGEVVGGHAAQDPWRRPQGLVLVAREQARGEGMEAGHAQAFGAAEALAVGGFA
jgi:hypothetical protein